MSDRETLEDRGATLAGIYPYHSPTKPLRVQNRLVRAGKAPHDDIPSTEDYLFEVGSRVDQNGVASSRAINSGLDAWGISGPINENTPRLRRSRTTRHQKPDNEDRESAKHSVSILSPNKKKAAGAPTRGLVPMSNANYGVNAFLMFV